MFKQYSFDAVYDCSPVTKCKNFSKLMYLITIGVDYNTFSEYLMNNLEEVNQQNEYNWTALMIASRSANMGINTDVVKLLLQNGADVNRQNNNGSTALMMAARYSNIDAVNVLLQNGADVNRQNNNGCAALMMAARYANKDSNIATIKLLLQNGADVNQQSNNGKFFTEYLRHKDLVEYMSELIKNENKYVKIQKKLHDRCIKKIPIMSAKITDRPDTLRTDMIHIKWELEKNIHESNIYDEAVKNDSYLLEYLGVSDFETFKVKIYDAVKYIR